MTNLIQYLIPILLTIGTSAVLLVFCWVILGDTQNPIQYLRNWLNARRMKREREKKFPPNGILSPQKEGSEYVVPMRATTTITTTTCTGGFATRSVFKTSPQHRLEAAIAREDYEEAARLRDEINKSKEA